MDWYSEYVTNKGSSNNPDLWRELFNAQYFQKLGMTSRELNINSPAEALKWERELGTKTKIINTQGSHSSISKAGVLSFLTAAKSLRSAILCGVATDVALPKLK